MPPVDRALIRRSRQERGMKLGECAELARIKAQYLANIESGHASPGTEVVHRIASVLGLRFEDLVADDSETHPDPKRPKPGEAPSRPPRPPTPPPTDFEAGAA